MSALSQIRLCVLSFLTRPTFLRPLHPLAVPHEPKEDLRTLTTVLGFCSLQIISLVLLVSAVVVFGAWSACSLILLFLSNALDEC